MRIKGYIPDSGKRREKIIKLFNKLRKLIDNDFLNDFEMEDFESYKKYKEKETFISYIILNLRIRINIIYFRFIKFLLKIVGGEIEMTFNLEELIKRNNMKNEG